MISLRETSLPCSAELDGDLCSRLPEIFNSTSQVDSPGSCHSSFWLLQPSCLVTCAGFWVFCFSARASPEEQPFFFGRGGEGGALPDVNVERLHSVLSKLGCKEQSMGTQAPRMLPTGSRISGFAGMHNASICQATTHDMLVNFRDFPEMGRAFFGFLKSRRAQMIQNWHASHRESTRLLQNPFGQLLYALYLAYLRISGTLHLPLVVPALIWSWSKIHLNAVHLLEFLACTLRRVSFFALLECPVGDQAGKPHRACSQACDKVRGSNQFPWPPSFLLTVHHPLPSHG